VLLAAGDWLMNSDVELLPPAFTSTVFASSNMKCADASLGWFGRLGMMWLLLDLYLDMNTINYWLVAVALMVLSTQNRSYWTVKSKIQKHAKSYIKLENIHQ